MIKEQIIEYITTKYNINIDTSWHFRSWILAFCIGKYRIFYGVIKELCSDEWLEYYSHNKDTFFILDYNDPNMLSNLDCFIQKLL